MYIMLCDICIYILMNFLYCFFMKVLYMYFNIVVFKNLKNFKKIVVVKFI